ncbi:MAG TPA: copper-binding protein [Lysobacter sp.]|nr:copper-binding protein [Lysobacter sp.]
MKTPSLIIALALAAACTPQDQDRAAGTEAVAPATQAPAAEADATPEPATASGTGEVTAVDPAAATVTIDHGPIDALEWPAMTMTFAAPGMDLASIKEGDKVSFELRQTGAMEATVTSIARDPAQ